VATSVVAVLTTAVGALMVCGWQADAQNRHDWTRLGLTPAHLCLAAGSAPASDIDSRYLTYTSDEALRQVFRALRAATCRVLVPARSAGLCSGQAVLDRVSDAGAASDADASKRASPRAVATRLAAAQTVARSWKGRHREKVITGRLRLVANGAVWPRWTTRVGSPAARAVEVIVLSASQDDRAQPPPDASVGPDGSDSTARPAARGPPQVVARQREVTESATGRRLGGSANASPEDIIVRDDLGPQIPICAAELEVIKTYLGHVLDGLLAASTDKPRSDKG
jgi:hypothetical protein